MQQPRAIRIRLLGGLDVVRSDDTTVGVDEWRTGMTMDLLRLLALENGRPVRPELLIDKLWPDAKPERARGSLRTASSQIRRAIGMNCIVRHPEGLLLLGAWVDVVRYLEDAARVSVAARSGDHARVLDTARSAEQLYVGDFRAHDDNSTWATVERTRIVQARHELLCDAATSALALHHPREAADLAAEAVRVNDASETARRLLMVAHAELGEIGTALRVFESYRVQLATELGVDPSPQTQELHLRLLRGDSA
jgi:DNA-binding SARP family transcriptional activator